MDVSELAAPVTIDDDDDDDDLEEVMAIDDENTEGDVVIVSPSRPSQERYPHSIQEVVQEDVVVIESPEKSPRLDERSRERQPRLNEVVQEFQSTMEKVREKDMISVSVDNDSSSTHTDTSGLSPGRSGRSKRRRGTAVAKLQNKASILMHGFVNLRDQIKS